MAVAHDDLPASEPAVRAPQPRANERGLVAVPRLARHPLELEAGHHVRLADTLTTLPVMKDRQQALKLARLWIPVWVNNLRHPFGVIGAGVSILRSGPSRWMLEQLAENLVPVFVIHGDKDAAVPIQTARDAAKRARGELIV